MLNQSKINDAVACYNSGYNCAQAVFSTYCEELGVDKKTALLASCGLGAGMGRRQETCGAVSGAYMLIGLKYGQFLQDDKQSKEKTYAMVCEFARLFEERNKSTSCRELLGVDLLNDEKEIKEARTKVICPQMVGDAVEIIEQLIFNK